MKRVAAIVLPHLAGKLGRQHAQQQAAARGRSREVSALPLGVIVPPEEHPSGAAEPTAASELLAAVDEQAWQYGVRPGQSVAEAAAYLAKLQVVRVSRSQITQALSDVAEIALRYGPTTALRLATDESHDGMTGSTATYPGGGGAGPADTVWLDITGCARRLGGEDLLCEELSEEIRQQGHRVRIAVADGPRIARAMARWGRREELIVAAHCGSQALASLPIVALPLEPATIAWLGQLGILRVDDLAQLERRQLASRLGPRARDLLALIQGHDDVPLLPYEPPRHIVEQLILEHELEGTEPLQFVLRGLAARAAVRLGSRGLACRKVRIELTYARAFARLYGIDPSMRLTIEPPTWNRRYPKFTVAWYHPAAGNRKVYLPCAAISDDIWQNSS